MCACPRGSLRRKCFLWRRGAGKGAGCNGQGSGLAGKESDVTRRQQLVRGPRCWCEESTLRRLRLPWFPCATELTRNTIIGTLATAEQFELNFDIMPTGRRDDWSNILHFTAHGNCGGEFDRIPAIFVHGKSTRLHVRMGRRVRRMMGLTRARSCRLARPRESPCVCKGTSSKFFLTDSKWPATATTMAMGKSLHGPAFKCLLRIHGMKLRRRGWRMCGTYRCFLHLHHHRHRTSLSRKNPFARCRRDEHTQECVRVPRGSLRR